MTTPEVGTPGECKYCGDSVVWDAGNAGQWIGLPPRDWVVCWGSGRQGARKHAVGDQYPLLDRFGRWTDGTRLYRKDDIIPDQPLPPRVQDMQFEARLNEERFRARFAHQRGEIHTVETCLLIFAPTRPLDEKCPRCEGEAGDHRAPMELSTPDEQARPITERPTFREALVRFLTNPNPKEST